MEVGWLEEEMGEEEPRDHTRTGLALSHAHGRKRFKEKDLKPRRGDRGQLKAKMYRGGCCGYTGEGQRTWSGAREKGSLQQAFQGYVNIDRTCYLTNIQMMFKDSSTPLSKSTQALRDTQLVSHRPSSTPTPFSLTPKSCSVSLQALSLLDIIL